MNIENNAKEVMRDEMLKKSAIDMATDRVHLGKCSFEGDDFRGYYICDKNGTTYLYSDGKLRFGTGCISDEYTPWWPSISDAALFLSKWAAESLTP